MYIMMCCISKIVLPLTSYLQATQFTRNLLKIHSKPVKLHPNLHISSPNKTCSVWKAGPTISHTKCCLGVFSGWLEYNRRSDHFRLLTGLLNSPYLQGAILNNGNTDSEQQTIINQLIRHEHQSVHISSGNHHS